jgi:hypothetical protein
MSIESNLKKLLKGEKACIPEHFLKVPSYNSPTLRTGKGRPISEGAFGVTIRLQQTLLEQSAKLPSFAFQGLDLPEDDVDVDIEDDEIEEVDEQ